MSIIRLISFFNTAWLTGRKPYYLQGRSAKQRTATFFSKSRDLPEDSCSSLTPHALFEKVITGKQQFPQVAVMSLEQAGYILVRDEARCILL